MIMGDAWHKSIMNCISKRFIQNESQRKQKQNAKLWLLNLFGVEIIYEYSRQKKGIFVRILCFIQ